MSTKTSSATTRREDSSQETETPREIAQDIVDYLTEYSRENPGYAALACLGIGFVLGWKLKPW